LQSSFHATRTVTPIQACSPYILRLAQSISISSQLTRCRQAEIDDERFDISVCMCALAPLLAARAFMTTQCICFTAGNADMSTPATPHGTDLTCWDNGQTAFTKSFPAAPMAVSTQDYVRDCTGCNTSTLLSTHMNPGRFDTAHGLHACIHGPASCIRLEPDPGQHTQEAAAMCLIRSTTRVE